MFAVIGQIVVGIFALFALLVLYRVAYDFVRAIVQTRRIARVIYGKAWRLRLKGQWRGYWRQILREMFSSYTSIQLGHVELPRNPWKPIKRRYLG